MVGESTRRRPFLLSRKELVTASLFRSAISTTPPLPWSAGAGDVLCVFFCYLPRLQDVWPSLFFFSSSRRRSQRNIEKANGISDKPFLPPLSSAPTAGEGLPAASFPLLRTQANKEVLIFSEGESESLFPPPGVLDPTVGALSPAAAPPIIAGRTRERPPPAQDSGRRRVLPPSSHMLKKIVKMIHVFSSPLKE